VDSIHLPNAIALPNAFGTPGTPLPPGQVVQALVLALIESDVFRLQLPQAVVDVRSDVALTPGSTITLAVKSGGANAKLVIYSDAPAAAPRAQGGVPSLAGRQPIGEAVIVARAPALPPTGVPAKTTTEPAIARDAPSISPARPVEPPVMRAVTPEQAIGEAVRVAASRQSGLAPLFADVEQVVQATNALPAPVRAAANDLLALRVPLDAPITATDVKQAFVRSGVLFEPRLAAKAAPAADANSLAPAPASDLKAALLVFRQVLKVWSASEPAPSRPVMSEVAVANGGPEMAARPVPSTGDAAIRHLATALTGAPEEPMPGGAPLSPEQATSLAKTVASALSTRDTPSQPAANQSGPPPPYRGAPLSAQAATAPSIALDAAPHEIADRLIAQTDGALARQTLLQVASLPDQPDMPRAEASQRWTFEIPFATPQGTSIAQFEVSRDGRTPQADPQPRTWRARFSLDVEPMGPVHALIALSGPRANVTLWAERATSASRLQDSAPLLSEALRAAELEPADFQLRVGAPPAMRQAAPGRFTDRAT
jgi:Flagellar hook-length control protein FliK